LSPIGLEGIGEASLEKRAMRETSDWFNAANAAATGWKRYHSALRLRLLTRLARTSPAGEVYDAETMRQEWPVQRSLPRAFWQVND